MNLLKKYLYIILVIQLFLSYTPAVYAQTTSGFNYQNAGVSEQISKYLCTPNTVPADQTNYIPSNTTYSNNNSGILYQCVNQIYKFAIILAAVIAVFFIVIAGYVYMSANGDQEAVSKAKNIMTTSIASIVILSVGYVFLKAINPDLIEFHSVQPPSVTVKSDGTVIVIGGGLPGSGTPTGGKITTIGSYNISSYATDPLHEELVNKIYIQTGSADFSTAAGIEAYIRSKVPSSPLTGQMVFDSAKKFNIDPRVSVAIMQADSGLGTTGKGATSNNPGNVGSTSTGSQYDTGNRTTYFATWQAGVDAVSDWLSKHRA